MNEKDFSSIFQSAVVISPRTLCKKLFYRAPAAQKWNKRQYKTRKRKKKKELQVLFSSSLYRSDLTGVCRSITNRFWPPALSLLPPDVAMTCLVQVLWHDTLAQESQFLNMDSYVWHARSSTYVVLSLLVMGGPWCGPCPHVHRRPSCLLSHHALKRFF